MRKVIIIDNNRVGLFDLCSMKIDSRSEAEKKMYNLSIRADDVLESKTLVKKIKKVITRRRKYVSSTNKR